MAMQQAHPEDDSPGRRLRRLRERIESGERLIQDYRVSGQPEYASLLRREIDDIKFELYVLEQGLL